MGFQTPIVNWLQDPWKDYFLEIINSKDFEQSSLIDSKTVKQNIEHAIFGKDVKYREGELAYASLNPFLWEKVVLGKMKAVWQKLHL